MWGQNKKVNNERLYALLGVSKDASDAELKKSYHRLARDLHPDKNKGDEERLKKFQEVSHAYEILSNKEKRKLYDQHGEEALNQGRPTSQSSIFEHFFGGGGGQSGPEQAEDVAVPLEVSLEDLYNGAKKSVTFSRYAICTPCEGNGSTDPNAKKSCVTCHGRGVRLVKIQMPFGVFQQQQECDKCDGKGEVIDPKFLCKTCNGRRLREEKKTLPVEIDRGMKDGHKIKCSHEGHQHPDVLPGDLIVVLRTREPDNFRRRHNDLIYKKEITLHEALFGHEFLFTHLDGRTLVVKTPPGGDVIEEGDIRVIPNEGMPVHGNPFLKGYLFIHYSVVWPKNGSLNAAQVNLLKKALPAPPVPKLPKEYEEHVASPYKESDDRGSSRPYYDDDDDDDDYDGAQQSTSCVHQ